MRYTLLLACAALASSVWAHPGGSDYGSSEVYSYSESSSSSSDENSYSGDKSEPSGKSWSGDSPPSYQGDSSYSVSSKSYESNPYSKADQSHETKTHASDYQKETKTHDSYKSETSESHGFWETHYSKTHASYSKETQGADYHNNSTTTEYLTYTKIYTETENTIGGSYTTIINISFSTETMGAVTDIPPTTTPLVVTSTYAPLFALTTTAAAIGTAPPLQQTNGTSTAPLAFTGTAIRSIGAQLNGLAAASFIALVVICL